jgi:hypothetical protein
VDSFRFVICARGDCRGVFFLCRHCDRGDRYCSTACAQRARRASVRESGRRYQHGRSGRLRHAARQARYRARPRPAAQKVTQQTSHGPVGAGMVPVSPPIPESTPGGDEEDAQHAATNPLVSRTPPVRCARCGRPGHFVRHATFAHLRARPRRLRP